MTFQVTVQDTSGKPIAYAVVTGTVEATGQSFSRGTDGGGYADLAVFNVPADQVVTLTVQSPLYQNHIQYPVTGPPTTSQPITVTLEPLSFRKPLAELAKLRGAMWTARLDLPYGPRPNQDDNCICIDYFECFSPSDQDRIIANYGPTSKRRYNAAPLGPIVDAGYHGQLPSTDWRDPQAFNGVYLYSAAKLERAGIGAVHFLRPDRGCMGLDWTVEDLDRELTPLFSTPRAQALMQRVILGWEPGPKYFYDNAWWVEMVKWMARVFPNALRGIHMVSDCDAPVGGDDDKKGISNGQGWANVAPYIHIWLVQNAGYIEEGHEIPSAAFLKNFTDQFNQNIRGSFYDRFKTGGPSGDWPTTSAWSALPSELRPVLNGAPYEGILAMPGEYAAFADYWQNWDEAYSQMIGQAAMDVGAYGFFDGGRG